MTERISPSHRAAFTLVELLVVIAIIAILAALFTRQTMNYLRLILGQLLKIPGFTAAAVLTLRILSGTTSS